MRVPQPWPVAAVNNVIFTGRFEAKEGLPESMTVAGGQVVEMTDANMVLDVPGRWDKFEIIRFVAPGSAAVLGGMGIHPGLSGGIRTARNNYNAVVWAASTMATVQWPYGTAALVPTDAQLTTHHQSPTHTRGRYNYILTPSGVTSASSRNDLGVQTSHDYIKFVEASNCYANEFGADGAVPSYETRIPSGVVPIKRVVMSWRDQGPHLICEWAAQKTNLLGCEIVELNPTQDVRNQTAELAVWLALSCVGKTVLGS